MVFVFKKKFIHKNQKIYIVDTFLIDPRIINPTKIPHYNMVHVCNTKNNFNSYKASTSTSNNYSVFIMETSLIVCVCNAVIVYFRSELPFLMHMVIGKCLFLRPVL